MTLPHADRAFARAHLEQPTRREAMVRGDLATDWACADKDAPLYAHMETMQRLPVPELDSSLAMYLHSVRPFLTEPEFEEYQVRPPRRAPTLRGASWSTWSGDRSVIAA